MLLIWSLLLIMVIKRNRSLSNWVRFYENFNKILGSRNNSYAHDDGNSPTTLICKNNDSSRKAAKSEQRGLGTYF